MYNATKWKDEVVDADTGEVIQEGTDQSAAHFNNAEEGISDNDPAARLMLLALSRTIDEVDTEVQTVTLTNTKSYPFNNSDVTVALETARNDTSYTVEATVGDHEGCVGDVTVHDQALNGFKVKYDGSATSVTITLRIKGGM